MFKGMNKTLRGKTYEAKAEAWLCARGLRPIARNFSARGGEIDLIMEDDATVVFVEVRFRASRQFVGALESITREKQRRLVHTASCWLQRYPAQAARPCRFDVVGMDGSGDSCAVTWIKAAFTA